MSNIEWQYMRTAERERASNLSRYILGIVFHLSGLVFLLVIHYSRLDDGSIDMTLALPLLAVYVADLLLWYLYLNNAMKFKEKKFRLTDEGVTIETLENRKVQKYTWEQFYGYSRDIDGKQRGDNLDFFDNLYLKFKSSEGQKNDTIRLAGVNGDRRIEEKIRDCLRKNDNQKTAT